MKKLIELNESNYHLMNEILTAEFRQRPKQVKKFHLVKEDSEHYHNIRYWLCAEHRFDVEYLASIMYVLGRESVVRQKK